MEGLLLLLAVAACPLMMWFMMRGMGGSGSNGQDPAAPADESGREAELRAEVAELRAKVDGLRRDEELQPPPTDTP